jgi:uncharacterized membrane protein YdjX (TVP38/TMEM64 family)
MRRRSRVAVGGLVVLAAGAALAVSPDAALGWLAWLAGDPVRFALALVAVALVRPLFFWPTTTLGVAAGFGFGADLAAVAFGLGLVTLSSLPTYALAGRLGGDGRATAVARRVAAATGEVRGVTAIRLFPVPSDVASAAAGTAAVGPVAFCLGTAVGEAPWVLAGVLAGASLESLPAGGAAAAAFDRRLVAAAALAGLALLAGPVVRRWLAGENEAWSGAR